MGSLENFVWWRVIRWWQKLHRWNWKDVRRGHTDHTARWRRRSADGIELFNVASVPITRYWYRGNKIPNPLDSAQPHLTADTVESPLPRSARPVRRAAWGNGPGANPDPAPQADSTNGQSRFWTVDLPIGAITALPST